MAHHINVPWMIKHWTERWVKPLHTSLHHVSSEDSEGLLEQEKNHASPPLSDRWRVLRLVRSRRYITIGISAGILLMLLTSTFLGGARSRSRHHGSTKRNSQALHVVIPTPDLSPEICKTVLSVEVLHYPTPTLLRWDATDQDPRADSLRRLTAVRDYLRKLLEHHEKDTVILLDSVSTWFQLRPDVLLQRYYDINREGNARLATTLGLETIRIEHIEQSVIFPTSFDCGMAFFDAVRCSQTPKPSSTKRFGHTKLPRYLGQGLVMGPVKDIHKVFRRAVEMLEGQHEYTSELAVFSEIFAIQEDHRSHYPPRTLSWSERFRGLFSGSYSHAPLAGRNATTRLSAHSDEFGIGLDYLGELSLDTSRGPETFAATQHRDLHPDVISSMPPFWTTSGQGLPLHKTWSDLDLVTNTYTHSVPVMISNNLTDDHAARQKQWQMLWLQPYARKLFDAYMTVPVMPLAAVLDGQDVEQIFWSPTTGPKAGAKYADGKWYGWDELCGGQKLASELFGDGFGEWRPKDFR